MSEDYHHHNQGIFSFAPPPSGFERADDDHQDEPQIRRDKLRLPEFGAEQPHHQLVGLEPAHPGVYEPAGMLSEMFNYGGGGGQIPESAAEAMQLFLTNPPPRSPSPPPHHHHHQPPPTHMLLPSQQFTWVPDGSGVIEGQRLSLSLSSNLEAAAKAEMGGGASEMMFFSNQEMGAPSSSNTTIKNFGGQHGQTQNFYGLSQHTGHFGFGSSYQPTSPAGVVNVLRNSKYTRPAQELLEEFCSVGRGHLRKNKFAKSNTANAAASTTSGSGGAGPSSNSGREPPPLSPAERMEHQRRKVKLLAMLDEVERRYSHYCEQMQMVVNSFDVVMGFGAAVPYTALAQKAMSRHFRCLKESIQSQLKHSCELLGEKDASTSMGLTKGETPRLKALEQSLRQQRAFHQMGIMEQEAWRPQRGLPERSVNVLRAWLFEHFLHPYPSDADKHLLARQTGLSRNQVSNWFINARVRLWKPMVEDMYQQEANENDTDNDEQRHRQQEGNNDGETDSHNNAQASTPRRSHVDASQGDPSFLDAARQHPLPAGAAASDWDGCDDYGGHDDGGGAVGPQMIRFGAAAGGDVSLTLGLRHNAAQGAAGNPPEKGGFSFREFGS